MPGLEKKWTNFLFNLLKLFPWLVNAINLFLQKIEKKFEQI
jgi:hypothetical protein